MSTLRIAFLGCIFRWWAPKFSKMLTFLFSAVIKHIHQNYWGEKTQSFRRFLPQDETLVTFCHAQFFMDDIFPSSLRDEKVVGVMFIMVSTRRAWDFRHSTPQPLIHYEFDKTSFRVSQQMKWTRMVCRTLHIFNLWNELGVQHDVENTLKQ